ncbi:uncharacterized protein LOC123553881 [Mercenaria mercenaria]|uniref:uncharacterized protein LOC123553881 n=1 Tax=Mercenaria mercenaria TaxID=6596 RepID=UPI00234E8FEE|nr:uncharacterized protein LOC123553881 [Mercenaria mercenaria]
MNMKTKTFQSPLIALLCFYLILILNCVTLFIQSWYTLKIDINKCSNCGRIIVAMGTLLEQAVGAFEDNTEVKDVSMETNLVYGMDEGIYRKSNEYDTIFKIENQINMYVGLWKTSLCTEDDVYCVDLDTDISPSVFAPLPLLFEIQENIIGSRQFFLLSTVIVVLTIIFATINFKVSKSAVSMIMTLGGLAAAFVSLVGVVIVSLKLFGTLGMSDIVTFRVPLMLILSLLSDYAILAAVFSVWRTWETGKSSVQDWFERSIRFV